MSSPNPSVLPEPAVVPAMDVPTSLLSSDEPQSSPDARSDKIEQIFQKVEQETERRALEEQLEEERSRPSTGNRPASVAQAAQATAAAGRDPARDRRRGSISVSRFGQTTDLSAGTTDNPGKLPSRKNSLIINASSTGAFYQAQKFAGSADSFASDTDDVHQHEDVHDEEQVTQMETIAGRVSLGKAMGRTIARRLSRARSRDILTIPSGLVIGVSVEEATVEAEHAEEDGEGVGNGSCDIPRTPVGQSFAYAEAEGTTRSRRSTISMPNAPPSTPSATAILPATTPDKRLSAAATNWMARAKDFTRIFKRRSMAVLPQSSNSSP